MANDKKFIVKNGLLTQESVVIGSTTFNSDDKLQVTGNTNIAGTVSIEGTATSLDIKEQSTNNFSIYNKNQDSGVLFNFGDPGLEIQYSGNTQLEFGSAGPNFLVEPRYQGSVFWNAGNDGANSGLDADLLDGIQSYQFVRSDQSDTMDGSYIITGNLTVNGTTTYINTETILLSDNIITLNANYTGSSPTENAGIEVERGTLNNPSLVWDETNDYWKIFDANLTDLGRIITTADEGANNGFDADTVDGLHAYQFLRSDADDTTSGNLTVQGALTVGNGGASYIYMDGVGQNRVIYSQQGEIGFLDQGFNWAARSDVNYNWIVQNDVQAGRDVIATQDVQATLDVRAGNSVFANNDVQALDDVIAGDNISAGGGISAVEDIVSQADVQGKRFLDFDDTSFLLDPAGTSRLNDIGLAGEIIHDGDTDTYIHFNAADNFQVVTGGTARFTVNNNTATASHSFTAPIYYDADNVSYYGDFAGESVMNDISLVGEIISNGDTNTYINFNAADTFQVVVGGSQGLKVETTGVTAPIAVYSPVYYDNNNVNYYGDFAGTSVMNRIGIDDYIVHNGDTNTYMGFSANDTVVLATNGSAKLTVDGDSADFTVDVYAPKFIDSDDNNYYLDPAHASLSLVANGELRTDYAVAVTAVDGAGNVTPAVDETRVSGYGLIGNRAAYYITNAATSGEIKLGNGTTHNADTSFTISSTAVTSARAFYAPIFYDSDDNNFYVNPAGSSLLKDLDVYSGDTTGEMNVGRGSSERFNIHVTDGVGYIRYYQDETDTTDHSVNFEIQSGSSGTNRFNFNRPVNVSGNVIGTNMYASIYYDADDNNYYGDFAGYSVMNNIDLDDKIRHNGDLDTHIGFGADTVEVQTGGTVRLTVANGTTTSTNTLAISNTTALTTDGMGLFGTVADAARWDDATGDGGISILPHGSYAAGQNSTVAVSGSNGGYPLVSLNRIDMGTNPIDASNQFIAFNVDGAQKFRLASTQGGDAFFYTDADKSFLFTSATGYNLTVLPDQQVVIGNVSATYASMDNTPLVGSITNSKLHVEGGIQLNGNDDAIVFGRGTASFLKDEELGFGWGSGWYMTDATYLRVRNNTAVYSTGDIYMNRYYDVNDTARWIEPGGGGSLLGNFEFASNSTATGYSTAAIELRESNYTGNATATPPYLAFHWGGVVASNIAIESTGRIVIRDNPGTGYEDFGADNIYGSVFYDIADNDYFWNPNTSSSHRFRTPSGYLDIGPKNTSYNHFQTDRAQHYFDKPVKFDGNISGYGGDETASFAIYYDSNDTNYYVDPNSTSVMARITLPQNPVGTGYSTTSTQPTYYIGQTSGDDDGWKIYSESPSGTNTGAVVIQSEDDFDGNESIVHRFKKTYSPYNTRDNLVTYYDHVYSPTEFRAPKFVDSNDVNYYGDFAGTSLTNIMRANQFQIDGSTYIIDSPAGDYGSIQVGGAKGGWGGYSIFGNWVFMADGVTNAGIYNDTRNEWMTRWYDNGKTELMYNGQWEMSTENGYGRSRLSHRAPIFYDYDNTSYFGDFAAGNANTALKVNGQIYRDGFDTGSNGDNNKFLVGQDYSHWIWNTATNWGIFWAGNDNAAYTHFGTTNPNELAFVGSGDIKASIDLDNGNAWFKGVLSAASFAINGGNEDLSLLKQYGTGYGDQMVFDGSEYWEKRVINVMQGIEANNIQTGDYVKNSDGPFTSSYVVRTSGYRIFYSDYIMVEPGEEIYGEMSVRYISGSGGLFYYGIERFDKDKNPIAGNTGTDYFVAGGVNVTSTSWQTFRNYHTIPTSHTVYNGSDGGGVRYIRIRILMNYNSGGALREFGPPILRRSNYQGRLRGDDIVATGDITATNYMYSQRYYDYNDGTYYADPAGDSQMNNVDVNRLRTRGSTGYFWDGNDQHSMNVYGEISNSNYANGNLQPGTLNIGRTDTNYGWEGSTWNSDVRVGILANFADYWEMALHDSGESVESALYYRSDTNTIDMGRNIGWGTTQIRHIGGTSSPIYYDYNDSSYYGDFASESRINSLRTAGYVVVGGTFQNNAYNSTTGAKLMFGGGNSDAIGNYYIGTNLENYNGNYNKLDLRWHTGIRIGAQAVYGGVRIYDSEDLGTVRFSVNKGDANTRVESGSFYARIMYDYDDAAYYVDPNSTSNLNALIVGGYTQNNPQQGQWYQRTPYSWNGSTLQHYYIRVANLSSATSIGAIEYYVKRDSNYPGAVRGTIHMATYASSGMSIQHDLESSNGQISPEVYIDNSRNVYIRFPGAEWNSFVRWRWIYRSGQTIVDDQGGLSQPANSRLIIPGKSYRMAYNNAASLTHDYDSPNIANRYDAHNSVRAPIFYDSNNVNYYGDFASTSRMNAINYDNIYAIGGGTAHFYTSGGNLRGYIQARDTDDGHFRFATSGGEDIRFMDGGLDGDWNMIVRGNGQTLISSRIDSPIFYDRNNTGYYVDPAGFSNLNTGLRATDIYARDWFRNDDSGQGLYNQATGQHWYSNNDDGWSVAGGGGANWIRFLDQYESNSRGYVYADNGNNIGFLNAGGGWAFRTNYSTSEVYGSLYADIMYDRNNSAYYVDPASTSYTNYHRVNNIFDSGNRRFAMPNGASYTTSSSSTSGTLAIYLPTSRRSGYTMIHFTVSVYEYSTGRTHQWRIGGYAYATGNWTNVSAIQITDSGRGAEPVYFCDDGSRHYVAIGSTGTSWPYVQVSVTDLHTGYSYFTTDWGNGWAIGFRNNVNTLRTSRTSSMAYTRNNKTNWNDHHYGYNYYADENTGYYLDPNGTSRLANITANFLQFDQGMDIYDESNYWMTIRSANNDGGGIYFRDNNSTLCGRLEWDDYEWIQIAGADGDPGVRVYDNAWTYIYYNGTWEEESNSNYMRARVSYRAPIFYDVDNTAYYFNGASNNSTRFRGVQSETMAYMGLSGQTRSSKEYYAARPRITSDSNYWTGAMGWGRVDMDVVANWGSGFIDSWSDPPNEPSGTSHWVGVQAYHYTNGSARYGWQMVGGPIGNLRFRNTWASFSSWKTIPMLDVNSDNGGSMYAGRYYDSNDTGYYTDPASTSQMNTITADRLNMRDRGDWITFYGNDNTYHAITSRDENGDASDDFRINSYDNIFLNLDSNNNNNGSALFVGKHGAQTSGISGWYFRAYDDGNSYASASFRAPIFYDTNDTAYYADPASTSNFNSMTFAGDVDFNGGANAINITSSDIRSSGTSDWTGDPGDDVLKIQAHSNRWYIVSNGNSNRIVQFRQNGSDRSYIANDGRLHGVGGTASADWRAPIFYDTNATSYYTNPASTSRMNVIQANRYESPYAGGDSNINRASYAYNWGFQQDGAWSNPYPDLVLQYHTGITMAAYHGYDGISFRQDYNDDTLRFRINGASNYTYKYTWMYTNDTGFYSDRNGAHIEPNTQTSYGSWNVRGNRNGWYGFSFHQADNDPHLMFDNAGSGRGGLYWEGGGRWAIFYDHDNNCLGVCSSTTSSTYELYVSGDIYATGDIVAFSDERHKENIITIDNALEKVLKLRGVYYDWKWQPETKDHRRHTGLIAQEVDQVMPEVVTYDPDNDRYGVSYDKLVGVLIEATKDQQEIINKQEQRLDEQQKEIDILKEMVYKLMEKQ